MGSMVFIPKAGPLAIVQATFPVIDEPPLLPAKIHHVKAF
jgi:hypothetical protein